MLHEIAQPGAVKDIVSKNKRAALSIDELLANDEGFGDAVGSRLHHVTNADAPLTAVAQERVEPRPFRFCGDYEDVANASEHQRVSCLELATVSGHSRDPVPPARMMPLRFVIALLKAWQPIDLR